MSLRIILIDADVISHFITAGEQQSLNRIFPNEIHVLDKVRAEASRLPSRKIIVDSIISDGVLKVLDFPENDSQIKQEYFYIKKTLDKGDGESAALAVARYRNNIIASSNLKDIKNYCTNHKIDFLTTMDFLCHALKNGLWNEKRCDDFIAKVLARKSKLPCTKMADHNCRILDFVSQ
jgi:hypothetical protein